MTESPGSSLCVAFAILAAVSLFVSGTTLLVARALRQRSAPTREVNLRVGLCLIAVWPLLVLVGGMVAPWTQGLDLGAGQAVDSITGKESAASDDPRADASHSVGVATAKTNEPQPTFERVDLPAIIPSEPVPFVAAVVSPDPTAASPESTESRGIVPSPVPVQSQSVTATETRLQAPDDVASSVPPPTPLPTAASPRMIPVSALWVLRGLSLLWGAGALVAGFALIRDLLRVRRIHRELQLCENDSIHSTLTEAMQATGLGRRPEVCLSSLIGSPCTSGAWRPILILPQAMLDHREQDSATLLGVLTHECAHIVRRDVAWSLLARVVQSVYWWEPGLSRIVRQLSHLREEICDNHVLSSSIDARLYAKALVDFAAGPLFRPMVGVIGMVGKDNPQADRVERLLQESPDTTTRLGWQSKWGVATIVVLVCGAIGVIGARAELSSTITRVLSLPFKKIAPSESAAFTSVAEVQSVPIWSGESPSRPASRSVEPAVAQIASEAAVAADSFSPLGTPTEAGSGVSAPQSFEAPFDSPPGVPEIQSPASFYMPKEEIPHNPPSHVLTYRYEEVPVQEIVNGESRVVTRMVWKAVMMPTNATSETASGLADKSINATLDEGHALSPQLSTIGLTLPGEQDFPNGTRVTVTATRPEGESLLPQRIRFEGLTIMAPAPDLLEPIATPSVPAETPPVEAAATEVPATPALEKTAPVQTHTIVLSGPQSAINVLAALKSKGAVLVVAKDDKPAPESVPVQRSSVSMPDEPAPVFRMSLEALADDAGQYKGFRCWGREWPTSDKGISELGEVVKKWKAELEETAKKSGTLTIARSGTLTIARMVPYVIENGPAQMQYRPIAYQVDSSSLHTLCSVELHVFDNMRYGDVQAIVKACEAQQLKVKIVSGSGDDLISAQPLVYTTAELALVYDKKGQRVGDRAVLLAEKAGVSGVQVISDGQMEGVLHNFVHNCQNSSPKLLLKVDSDLPFETLQTFIIHANRAGILHVELKPSEELQLRSNDQLVPLVSETLQPVAEPTRVKPDGDYQLNRAEPTIDEALPRQEGPHQSTRNFSPSGEITPEFEPASSRKPGRVRWDPQPIPSVSLVREH